MIEAEGHPKTTLNTPIMLVSYDGIPKVVVEITDVYETTFGNISLNDTSLDGPPVRNLDVWIPLHTEYWNGLLSKHNLSPKETLLIGDTEYDCRVADSLGCAVFLVSYGHINGTRLSQTGKPVVSSVKELEEYLSFNQ